jgi:hypothetical protein
MKNEAKLWFQSIAFDSSEIISSEPKIFRSPVKVNRVYCQIRLNIIDKLSKNSSRFLLIILCLIVLFAVNSIAINPLWSKYVLNIEIMHYLKVFLILLVFSDEGTTPGVTLPFKLLISHLIKHIEVEKKIQKSFCPLLLLQN